MDNSVRAEIKVGAQSLLNDPRARADFVSKFGQQMDGMIKDALETMPHIGNETKGALNVVQSVIKGIQESAASPLNKNLQRDLAKIFLPDISSEEFKVLKQRAFKELDEIQKEIASRFTFHYKGDPTAYSIASLLPAPSEKLRKTDPRTAEAMDRIRDEMEDATGSFRDATDQLKVAVLQQGKEIAQREKAPTEPERRGLPTYFASALLGVLSDARQGAGIWQRYETTFDMSSPQGMMATMMMRNLQARQGMFELTGQTIGQIAGGIIGNLLMPGLGTLPGVYLGGAAGSSLGDLISMPDQVQRQIRLQTFQSLWGIGERDISMLAQQQGMTFGAARRWGGRYGPAAFLGGDTSETGLNPAEWAQYMDLMAQGYGRLDRGEMARGIRVGRYYGLGPEDLMALESVRRYSGNETPATTKALSDLAKQLHVTTEQIAKVYENYMQQASMIFTQPGQISRGAAGMMALPGEIFGRESVYGNPALPQGQATLGVLNAMVTPGNHAENAMMFAAIKRANPRATPWQIMWQMQQGIANPQNLSSLLQMLPEAQMREMYLNSILINKGLSPGIAQDVIGRLGNQKTYEGLLKDLNSGTAFEAAIKSATGFDISKEELQKGMSPAQVQAAKVFQSSANAAEKVQREIYAKELRIINKQNEWLDDAASLGFLTKEFEKDLEELDKKIKDILNPTQAAPAPTDIHTAIEKAQHPTQGEFLRYQPGGRTFGAPVALPDTVLHAGDKRITFHMTATVEDSTGLPVGTVRRAGQ